MWTDTWENWIFDLVINNLSLALTNVYYICNILHNTCIDHMYAIAEKMRLTWNICIMYLPGIAIFFVKSDELKFFGESVHYKVSCLVKTQLLIFSLTKSSIYLDLIYNNIVTFINCMHIGHVNQQQHTMLNLGDFDIILEISTYLQTLHH